MQECKATRPTSIRKLLLIQETETQQADDDR